MKPNVEMVEGTQAFAQFKDAVRKIVSVKKSDLPPSPFKKTATKKKKPAAHRS